jgi:hypothetical protein
MENASKRVLGNFLNRADLPLSDELLLPNESALAPRISADAGRQPTLMAKSTVSELSRLCGKQDFKYGE